MSALGKTCSACSQERKKMKVLYDPKTLLPYCENPYICNEQHPNSPDNLLKRGEYLAMLTFEEAQEQMQKMLILNQHSPEKAARIRRMVLQPSSIRIGEPDLAEFILEIQDEFGYSSVSDAIRYCLRAVKEGQTFYAQRQQPAATQEPKQPEPQPEYDGEVWNL